MNQLYTEIMKQQMGGNNMLQRFMQFRNSFSGNAKDQVQQLLNSGKISQAQYDNAVKMAQQFQQMLNIK